MAGDTSNPIRAARELRGVTQLQLAAACGLALGTVSLAERGVVTDRTLEAVAKVLGVPVAQLRGATTENGENMASSERSFLGVPMQSGGHVAAIMKALSLPPASPEEQRRMTRTFEAMKIDVAAVEKIARARDAVSSVAKGIVASNAFAELDAAEQLATARVAVAKEAGRAYARALAANPNELEPTRVALRETFERLCSDARAGCEAVTKVCHNIIATAAPGSPDAQAIGARAHRWLDVVANLRDVNS